MHSAAATDEAASALYRQRQAEVGTVVVHEPLRTDGEQVRGIARPSSHRASVAMTLALVYLTRKGGGGFLPTGGQLSRDRAARAAAERIAEAVSQARAAEPTRWHSLSPVYPPGAERGFGPSLSRAISWRTLNVCRLLELTAQSR